MVGRSQPVGNALKRPWEGTREKTSLLNIAEHWRSARGPPGMRPHTLTQTCLTRIKNETHTRTF